MLYGAFMAPTINEPITNLALKWGPIVEHMLEHHPEQADAVNPQYQKAKADKQLSGMKKKQALPHVIAAQLVVAETSAKLQALTQAYNNLPG